MGDNPGPFRWLPAATIVALAWLTLFPIVSVDAHYHLATGRRILEEGAIPERGVGSATFGQAPWHDNEWGFQVLVAWLDAPQRDPAGVWVISRRGLVGLILLRALCLAATLGLVSAQMARAGVGAPTRSAALALAAFLTFGNLFWAIRPQILSYLGLVAVAYLIERDRGGERWAAWAVLPLIAVWANVHGAFLVGIALLATEAAGEALDAWRGQGDRRRAARLALVTVLAPLAACLNPYGYRQVLHPFLYLVRPEIHRGNVEWTRPDFLHLPLFVLTLALLALALVARGRGRTADLLRCLAFTLLLFSAIRHLPLAALVLVPVLASAVAAAARRGGWRARLEPTGPAAGRPVLRLVAATLIVAAVIALSGAFTRSGARFVTLWPRFEYGPVEPMPEAAVRFVARSGVGGSIFNGYRFGGFLMYRLYPEERVFMDGRNDLYGTFRDEVYNRILRTEPGWRGRWRAALREYDVSWVLIDEAEGLHRALAAEAGWSRIFPSAGAAGDPGIVLWLRDRAARGSVATAARAGVAAPDGPRSAGGQP